jgi:membrane protease YdiL (CAAX protease family)
MDNALIEAARSGRPPAYWRIALYFLVAFGLPFMLSTFVGTTAMVAYLFLGGPATAQDVLDLAMSDLFLFSVGGIFVVGTIVVTALWVVLIDQRPLTSIGLRTRRPAWEWLRGMLVGAGLMGLAVGLMAAFGTIQAGGSLLENPARLLGVAGALFFFLIQGPAEEIVFRGYLLPVLGARGNLTLGIVVSSLLFGLAHILNPSFGLLPLINIVLAGVLFALYALVEEGLWGAFGLHSAWNWVQGNVLGMAVSGGFFGPSVFTLREAGPDWLTGGAFGPEGGVVVTGLLVLASGWLGWLLWRKERARSRTGAAPDPEEA